MPANILKSTGSAAQIAQQARARFNFEKWAAGYFDVAVDGRVVHRLPGTTANEVALTELIDLAAKQDLQLPLLIRFTGILTDRVRQLCRAFDRAFAHFDYQAPHSIAYPIKVNQQRCVVEQITQALPDRVGLEAGSKPELMAVLAQSFNKTRQGDPVTIICNGYKDREYIRLALIGGLLGKRIFIVVEQPDELELVLEQARALNTKPLLGVRIRLTSIAKGRWQNSGGEKSKFGLSATQLLAFLERLTQRGQLDALKLLHFHIGSQVADIADVTAAMQEAARYYQELHRVGARIEVLDVGGGLGVDYEGNGSAQMFSINYSVEDYARSIVSCIADQCRRNRIPEPEIITECGRALTAHHAVLVTEVLDVEKTGDEINMEVKHPVAEDIKQIIRQAGELSDSNQVTGILEQCDRHSRAIHEQYLQGRLSLAERSGLDSLIMHAQLCLQKAVNGMPDTAVSSIINERLADKYFCNFSVFQSTPDVWGIQQVFPVVPLARLHEPLTRHAVVHDLTCDSDGQINRYPVQQGLSATLPVHALIRNEPYYLGIFLVGAYQEILGDMHNLFGDTHSVNVVLNDKGRFELQDAEPGDRVDQLLEFVHYDSARLLAQYRNELDQSKLSAVEKDKYYEELANGLSGYTYLEE
jgi:arginine decarboxylase